MRWNFLGEFISLIIQTNLSPSLNNSYFTTFQITVYYLQLTYFLISENHEYIYRLINALSRISLITPIFIETYEINILIGVIIIILNIIPYLIVIYRRIKNVNKKVGNISKSILQMATMIINFYFLYFTWFLYLPQLYYIGWNYLQSDSSLNIIATIVLFFTVLTLTISNVYFVNFEFNEQHLRKHFSYNNLIAQTFVIPMAILYLKNDEITQIVSRTLHGLILAMQIYEAYFQLPFGFSQQGYIFNRALMTHSVVFLFSSIKALSTASPYSLATIMLIMQPVVQYLFQILFDSKRANAYLSINKTNNQYYELLYIEDFFELSQLAQKNKTKEIELIQKFSLHMNRCNSTKCQCRKIGSQKILLFDETVLLISCLFKGSFEKHKLNYQDLRVFEIFSLKFLTFINKYKHNAPKTYQELKIFFQKKRDYSFYFIQMCLLLQFILQAQMQKDEDYNINKETRVSNVKLQVSKSERSIVQNLYQMEQVKQNMIPLLTEVSQFKSQFWKSFKEGKFSDYLQIEDQIKKLQKLRDDVMYQFNIYYQIFYQNGRTYNVQFLKVNALIDLLLFNNVRKYFEMEKERREILSFEKSMNSFEITNINFFKGEAISVKVCIAFGPNIGKVLNKVISPLIPKFFGFGKFPNPTNAFVDFTKGNINTLMPVWLEPIHDEIMQNYIRRGVTARIGKYFQTFAKLYDKTLIRCQVYLAHNFSQELEDDFTMIGCLKSLEEEQPKFVGDEGKKLKNIAFKGAQHILFDVNGNIMGITKGLYKMIERLQRLVTKNKVGTYHENDEILQQSGQKSKSENSSVESESYDVFDQKWSNAILQIDDFYNKVLIWMILPFISREIESTGIEFLMNGQAPPKNRYANLIDLENGNQVVQNKETYLFVPEDLNLFVQQYDKVITKIVDDLRVQSNNFSSGSAYRGGQRSEYQESDQQSLVQVVTIFDEKLCVFFYEEHLKRHQALLFGQTRQSEMQKSQGRPSSKSSIPEKQTISSEEDSEQLKTRAEKIYQDRYSKYIEKFTPQDFNPIPVVYSVFYEEYRYKKNDTDHKQQMFVIELIVNDQQLLNTEKGYKRQLRETIKQTYQNYQQKKLLLEQRSEVEDSMSIQGNISEQRSVHEGEIINYNFPSHPSHYYEDIYFVENNQILQTDQIYSPRQDGKSEGMLLSGRSRQSKPLLEKDTKTQGGQKKKSQVTVNSDHSREEIQFKGSYSNLKFPEKEIAFKALARINQKKKQQDFFNDNESKIPVESKGSQQQIFEEFQVKYSDGLKLFDSQYKVVQQKTSDMKNPNSYKIQKYLLITTFILIVSYIILISVAVQKQYNLSECYDLLELMIATQKSYSQITHSLYRLELSDLLQIDNIDILKQFYEKQIFSELQQLIDISSSQIIEINQVQVSLDLFYDIEDKVQIKPTLQQIIQFTLGQFYRLKQNETRVNFKYNSSLTLASVANLEGIGQLPQKAYDYCFDDKVSNENTYQTLLIVYMVVIFFLVMILQFSHIPLIGKLRKSHRTFYKEIIKLQSNEVNDEIEIYETVVNIFKKSIYEWMLIDFVQESQMFEITREHRTNAITPGREMHTDISQGAVSSSNKKNKYNLMEKLKKSQMRQVKYFVILMVGLFVILAYFLIIFLVIFILSKDLLSNVEILFKFKLVQSSVINLINNMDLVAFSSVNDLLFDNVMSVQTYQTYAQVLSGDTTDYFQQYSNEFFSALIDNNLKFNLDTINQNNICEIGIGIDCESTDAITLNPWLLPYYQQGLKSLLTQVDKIISQYPYFFDDQNAKNSQETLFEFYQSQEHLIYIDYGSELIIKAQKQIIDTAYQQFDQSLNFYKQTLLIFTLSVGVAGFCIIGFLGNLILKMQKDSIETCQAALLLLSPKRYLNKSMGLLTQKKL
ncbi:unnamed protein product (macronuclear) [Paramecium tetraurelia]|uniref:Transmembrane protein n=1 Tax=Paramecium tetraurelia TaxID=5888 RepID=A0ECP6_PARTE|nr:uncharacterized protein GSPATT00003932001 [Paramecium tetraurelia]CAK93063.1 unnamed protein product [Paramecium tetraurelia]|eukprot:XP_001460460.1 hypothetical protein (macronuclear) [Paramecium tetraurelia strain d4-2]